MLLLVVVICLAMFPYALSLVTANGSSRLLKDVGLAVTLIAIALGLFPRTVYTFESDDIILSDIASPSPTLWTYHIALLSGMVLLWKHSKPTVPLPFVFVSILAPGLMMIWEFNVTVLSGYVHLLTAVLAWGIGTQLATCLKRDAPEALLVVRILFAVLAIQAVVTVLQHFGADFPSLLTATGQVNTDRPGGTLGNAGVLSKVPVLFLFFCLPLSGSLNRKTQFWSIAAITIGLVLAGITLSRANIFAMVAAILIWMASTRTGLSFGKRLFLIAVIGFGSLLFLDEFLLRFQRDDGGTREYLRQVALTIFPDAAWFGIGLNSYVEHASRVDAYTAMTGFPVHNAVFLLALELGLPLFFLLMLPVVNVFGKALFTSSHKDSEFASNATGRALLPGILVISLTGWGIAGGASLILLSLCLGFTSKKQTLSYVGTHLPQQSPKPRPTTTNRRPTDSTGASRIT